MQSTPEAHACSPFAQGDLHARVGFGPSSATTGQTLDLPSLSVYNRRVVYFHAKQLGLRAAKGDERGEYAADMMVRKP